MLQGEGEMLTITSNSFLSFLGNNPSHLQLNRVICLFLFRI